MPNLARWLIGTGLAAIVVLAIWFLNRPAPEPAVESAAEPATEPAAESVSELAAESTAEPAAESGAAPVAEVEPEPQQEPDAAPVEAPQFDVVRVSPQGQTVIAGRAAPGQTVEILLDGTVIGTAEADASGAFAAVTNVEPSSEARVLTMRTALGEVPEATIALAPSTEEQAAAAAKVLAAEAAAAEQAAAEAAAAEAKVAADAAAADSAAKRAAAEAATAEAEAAEAEAAAAEAAAKAAVAQTAVAGSGAETGTETGAQTGAVQPTTDAATGETVTDQADEAVAAATAEAAQSEAAAAEAAADAALAKAAAAEAEAAEAATAEVAAAATAAVATTEAIAAKQAADAAASGAEPDVSRYAVSAPVIILPPEGAEQAPILLQPEPEGVTLLQPAEADPTKGIVLDRITYSDLGDLLATGRSRPGTIVRVYANAKLVEEVRDDNSGQWEVRIASEVATSTLLLRFDEVDSEGRVLSRLEAPFEYSPLVSTLELRERKIEVQKGDYLWKFAQQQYGEGWHYSVIFSANSNLIRDPDLIYPGQVFSVPELVNSP